MAEQLLRARAVLARIGISRTQLYELVRAGKFPPPVSVCGGHLTAWHEAVVDEWIRARPAPKPDVAGNARRQAGLAAARVRRAAGKRKQP
jgi:prophage regulatory protein